MMALNLLSKKQRENLKIVFSFYCNQHFNVGNAPTFDALSQNQSEMGIAEFKKMIRKDFAVLYQGDFKKLLKNKKAIDFSLFW